VVRGQTSWVGARVAAWLTESGIPWIDGQKDAVIFIFLQVSPDTNPVIVALES
jgi:hypothetical protein